MSRTTARAMKTPNGVAPRAQPTLFQRPKRPPTREVMTAAAWIAGATDMEAAADEKAAIKGEGDPWVIAFRRIAGIYRENARRCKAGEILLPLPSLKALLHASLEHTHNDEALGKQHENQRRELLREQADKLREEENHGG